MSAGVRRRQRGGGGRLAGRLVVVMLAWLLGAGPAALGQMGSGQAGTGQGLDSGYGRAVQMLPVETPRGEAAVVVRQITTILRDHPEVMSEARALLGQTTGADVATIDDAQVYERLGADADFRSTLAAALEQRGYLSRTAAQAADEQRQGEQGVASEERQLGVMGAARATGVARSRTEASAVVADSEPEPQLQSRRVPYQNLPSLRDLYQQYPAETGTLKRFGGDAFQLGTGNAQELPMDLPAGPDYVLGPGDGLTVNLWGSQSAQLSRVVDRQGQVALPEAGAVQVGGLTLAQAEKAIERAFGAQLHTARIEISLGRVRTVRVYVVGDVQRPGAYDLSSLGTALNALYAAGGPTARGSLRTLRHLRGREVVAEIDLYDFLLRGVRTGSERLQPGDTILVPPVGAQVTVAGMVKRPAIYELKGGLDLAGALELAGGPLVAASLKQVRVERVEAHERRTMLSAELGTGQLPVLAVADGDTVTVAPILPYREKVVYLDGHVFRPGRYPWREGMTVADLVRSYQEILPEPATHAEIIRLRPPELRPETVEFNLAEAMAGKAVPALAPYDVVRLFGRYEIDAPQVTISGEVLRPGPYPMAEGMTVAELLRMAGGPRRSAYRFEGDLTSYEVEAGRQAESRHRVVDLARILAGDKTADVALKPGDVLGIRQMTGWRDIGAAITIEGEVRYAGTFGIEAGERLSAVLRRAGGFRESAFAAGAVLERVQVRQAEEQSRQEMIRRVEATAPVIGASSGTMQEQLGMLQAMQQQQQQVLAALRSQRSNGRLVVHLSAEIERWENTAADIELRAGDRLTIPKRPDFVVVSGQVYNGTGISFTPGKDAGWYLGKAGGVTRLGDKRNILIVRADGSVASPGWGLLGDGVLRTRIQRGDAIVVPEKVTGGSQIWRNVLATAQIMSSLAITGAVAGAF